MQSAGSAGKEYKSKFQSLWFNLKDPHNPDLRARVLKGELPPDRLVRMSAVELASRVSHGVVSAGRWLHGCGRQHTVLDWPALWWPLLWSLQDLHSAYHNPACVLLKMPDPQKCHRLGTTLEKGLSRLAFNTPLTFLLSLPLLQELAEYRKPKELESLKMSVLDAEAAARFSTAAALDARDRLAVPAQLVADKLLSAREAGAGGAGDGGRSRSPSPLPAGAFGAAGAAGAGVISAGGPRVELAMVHEGDEGDAGMWV
jgi:hypothetical protein